MESKRFGNLLAIRVKKGEELMKVIEEACIKHDVKLGTVTGLGATNKISVGVYSLEDNKYHRNDFECVYEIASVTGNITQKDDKPYLHIHAVFADVEGRCFGGHLNSAIISVTGEIFIHIFDGEIDRKIDDEIGINLMAL